MNEALLGILIPIIAVTLGLSIPIVKTIADYKRKRALIEAMNRERIAAIEKGVAPPSWPEELLREKGDDWDMAKTPEARENRSHAQLTAGLITLAIGVAILFGLAPLVGVDTARAGFIPIGIGAALLIAWAVRSFGKSNKPEA